MLVAQCFNFFFIIFQPNKKRTLNYIFIATFQSHNTFMYKCIYIHLQMPLKRRFQDKYSYGKYIVKIKNYYKKNNYLY